MNNITNRYGILDRISGAEDLRGLSFPLQEELCNALRDFIVDHVSQTGGHLASNLGIVELAVVLEREFDSRRDRIIYDVGHQSYVHKILTGRKDQFDHLRMYGGLCGFMKPSESITDPCITGHASSSVSVALGMAHARTIRGEKYHVVAVIGDGALTGGMAYEALTDAGASKEPIIVVLNDNNMSIDKNVGGMARHLARLRVSPRYLNAKSHLKHSLARIPGGKAIVAQGTKIKSAIKSVMLPSSMFEQMGFTYLGPVDGHDLKALTFHLQLAKRLKCPVLLHVMTKKGKGYPYAENAPEKFHGVPKFDASTGKISPSAPDFSAIFGAELSKLARSDVAIAGDIPAIFAVDRAGIVGADGATHNGTFDIPFLRTIPGMTILCPSNFAELRAMLTRALYHNTSGGAIAIRYPRGGEGEYRQDTSSAWAKCIREVNHPDVTIVAYGILINEALMAAQLLEREGIWCNIWKINEISPETERLSQEMFDSLAKQVAIVEDVVQNGSFAEAFQHALAEYDSNSGHTVHCYNVGNRFLPHGSVREIYKLCGIDGESLASSLKNILQQGKDKCIG